MTKVSKTQKCRNNRQKYRRTFWRLLFRGPLGQTNDERVIMKNIRIGRKGKN